MYDNHEFGQQKICIEWMIEKTTPEQISSLFCFLCILSFADKSKIDRNAVFSS